MEFSSRSPFLDPFGKPLPEHIQHALKAVTSRLRRKFSMIRDDVVYTEILEHAGQLILKYESIHGAIKRLYGFAWVWSTTWLFRACVEDLIFWSNQSLDRPKQKRHLPTLRQKMGVRSESRTGYWFVRHWRRSRIGNERSRF